VNEFSVRLSLEGGKLLDLHGPADITQETTEANRGMPPTRSDGAGAE